MGGPLQEENQEMLDEEIDDDTITDNTQSQIPKKSQGLKKGVFT